jgi:hypothetical protein
MGTTVEEDGMLFEQRFDIKCGSPSRPFNKQACKSGRMAEPRYREAILDGL